MKTRCLFVLMSFAGCVFVTEKSHAIGPSDILRNDLAEIITIPPPGEPGVDFVDDQFIASLKEGYLILPAGKSYAKLEECEVESDLLKILLTHDVSEVEKVFTDAEPGDTIVIVENDTIFVPDISRIFLFKQNVASGVLEAVEDMYSHNATIYAEPNAYRFPDRTPNDFDWGNQWNLKDINNGIGCQFSWDATSGAGTIKIGMIDTGIDYNHNELGGPGFPNNKVIGGYDFGDLDNDPMDIPSEIINPYAHGTACAGIVGALTNNELGVAGIAGGWGPNEIGVKPIAAKIYDNNGAATDEAIVRAIKNTSDPHA